MTNPLYDALIAPQAGRTDPLLIGERADTSGAEFVALTHRFANALTALGLKGGRALMVAPPHGISVPGWVCGDPQRGGGHIIALSCPPRRQAFTVESEMTFISDFSNRPITRQAWALPADPKEQRGLPPCGGGCPLA